MVGLYEAMTGRLRRLSEPRLERKISDTSRKGYSYPMGEIKVFSSISMNTWVLFGFIQDLMPKMPYT